MQIGESEIVILLMYKARLKRTLIRSCAYLVVFVGLFVGTIVLVSQATRASRFPDIQETAHGEIVFGLVCIFLMLLFYGLLFVDIIRKLRGPAHFLRINHEGIFSSVDSFLLRWEEIKELTLTTFLGNPILGIVPWNVETVVSRVNASSTRSRRFAIDLTLRLALRAKSPTPFGIAQKILPISIAELIMVIQEHFASEIREHHITVQGWQQ